MQKYQCPWHVENNKSQELHATIRQNSAGTAACPALLHCRMWASYHLALSYI